MTREKISETKKLLWFIGRIIGTFRKITSNSIILILSAIIFVLFSYGTSHLKKVALSTHNTKWLKNFHDRHHPVLSLVHWSTNCFAGFWIVYHQSTENGYLKLKKNFFWKNSHFLEGHSLHINTKKSEKSNEAIVHKVQKPYI